MSAYYFAESVYRDASRNYYAKLMEAALEKDDEKAEQVVKEMMEQSIQMWKEQTAVKH
jgi:GntR family negative regulator for fad regulon and positive regulator of fabA